MARIRTIKPDFFRHLELYNTEKESNLPIRVAFAGLWTSCDREGRFRWNPEVLKLDCLPFDNIDFSRVLNVLWTRGFIEKYNHENKIYGFIPSWKEHQFINNRESESVLPNPYESSILTCDSRDVITSDKLPRGREGKGRGKGKEGEKEFVPPTLDEVKLYFKENEFNEETAIRMFKSYSVADWVDSKGNKVKNWKQKAQMVWFKPENRINLSFKKVDESKNPTR